MELENILALCLDIRLAQQFTTQVQTKPLPIVKEQVVNKLQSQYLK